MKWSEGCSVVSDSLQSHGLYSPWNSPGQNTRVGSLSLLQGIFPTQESNPGFPHCRRIPYQLSHQGRGRDFEELGHHPLFGLWWSALEMSWLLWGYHLAHWCVTVNIYWGSKSNWSRFVHHLGPMWFSSVYVVSSGYVLLSNFLPCPLPSRFTWRCREGIETISHSGLVQHGLLWA